MRAARLHAYGAPLVLEDVPEPELGPADLLVQIHASSINPIDFKIHAGGQRAFVRLSLPWVTGLDLSGTVLAVGSKVQGFQVGDAVYGSPTHTRPGTFAERIAVDHAQVAHKPPSLSHTQAASLPLVFQTAWACLMPALTRAPGQRVFIHAGSGGVGTLAIQLAKHHGAWVATTCSQRNHQLVRDLGADQVIDYRSTPFEDALEEPVDILLDALGGQARAQLPGHGPRGQAGLDREWIAELYGALRGVGRGCSDAGEHGLFPPHWPTARREDGHCAAKPRERGPRGAQRLDCGGRCAARGGPDLATGGDQRGPGLRQHGQGAGQGGHRDAIRPTDLSFKLPF